MGVGQLPDASGQITHALGGQSMISSNEAAAWACLFLSPLNLTLPPLMPQTLDLEAKQYQLGCRGTK